MNLQALDIKHATAIALVVFTFIHLIRLFTRRWKASRDPPRPENRPAATKFAKPNRKPGGAFSTPSRSRSSLYPPYHFHHIIPIKDTDKHNQLTNPQNGSPPPSNVPQHPPTPTGTFTPRNPSPTVPSNTDRELTEPSLHHGHISNPSRKYFITMGLRSMKWDEWIGQFIHQSSQDCPTVKIVLNTSDHPRTRQPIRPIPRRKSTTDRTARRKMLSYSARGIRGSM